MAKLIDGVLHTRESIIHQFNDLVYKNARNLCRQDYHYMEDLAQEGFIGLLDAFDRYDPDSGNRFMTYAYAYVRGYMVRLHDKRNMVHVPHSVIRLAWQIQRKNMWDKSDEEIAEAEGQTVYMVAGARIYFATRHHASLDKAVYGNDEDGTLLDFRYYEQDFSTAYFGSIETKLDPRERFIVHKLYQGYMQSEIAPVLGISRQRVGYIVSCIRKKLKQEIS